MVKDKVVQIINSNLKEYVNEKNVKFTASNNVLKYVIEFKLYYIEICYIFLDDFYRIKIEYRKNNQLQDFVFLTKSKLFYRDIKMALKERDLTKKSFENHMIAFTNILKKTLDSDNNLDCLRDIYIPNLKFDGVFL